MSNQQQAQVVRKNTRYPIQTWAILAVFKALKDGRLKLAYPEETP